MLKYLVFALFASLSAASFAADPEKPKTKQVCKDVMKNGKPVQQCKTVKVHKKLEGKKVPDKK